MKAMLFAAGIGSRLQPLTNNKPKALVEVAGKPMIEHAINLLKKHGFREIIINLHHFPEQIKDFIEKKESFGIDISYSDESNELLDTGGGLKKASWFFDDQPFLIYNADIITNIDLSQVLNFHKKIKSLATLVVRNRTSSRYLMFDEKMTLNGWKNTKSNEEKLVRKSGIKHILAFSGVHIADPALFRYFPPEKKFSIIDLYLKAATKENISGYTDNNSYWFDIGNLEKLEKARNFMQHQK